MTTLFGILYALILIVIIVIGIFIIFHIIRYSLNRTLATILILLFISVTCVLLLLNFSAFSTIPFNHLFS
ncbi:MAG TPA: hypothetical protein VJL38_01175 [Patescibacteria group bacterium]|nr:hypothetical protein [Patescibacteria group bacterium]